MPAMSRRHPVPLLLFLVFVLVACGPSAGGGDRTGDGGLDCGATGMGDCDGDPSNGCEAALDTVENCGQCGVVCNDTNAVSATCGAGGQCVLQCAAGFADCDGDPSNGCEVDLNSPNNCGECYNSCTGPNAIGTCNGGQCEVTCSPGYGDCNDNLTDGCETETNTLQHCGACLQGCAGDCDGSMCEVCDVALAIDSTDPLDAARAMGLCSDVISARWVNPDGSDPNPSANFPLGHGILTGFGNNVLPRQGGSLLALSSGAARQPNDPGYRAVSGWDKGYTTAHPPGFPVESPACPGTTTGQPHDGVGLELELQVPDWAEGLAFDFNFYTYEWPVFICSTFNDFFVALLDPPPMGQPTANISFDSQGNPISVNNALLSVCGCLLGPPCLAGGKMFDCPGGITELAGTGFEGAAATGWLTTTAPVEPGTVVTLRLAVYDSGDGDLDSTTIIDNFRWLSEPPAVETNPVD
jgi:hypothetical protein